ncbi:MAG TPA: cache domain-containing protein [Spirochaetota bacterium]|nr:cache domain-containing protein [Spirochaetota bacterium]HPF07928.1 cache domain-containing protein [Spirochaetota bacterium]HPJ42080.1 cache domain-containing protein [Spirochaetota bacterium]HPR36973.1 cache domain-containing protein [Spirochaetota bacterium]HRX47599.1 cache domain-containing protein [Spirochaetota bacterium]
MKCYCGRILLILALFLISNISCKEEAPVEKTVKEDVVEETVKPYDADAEKAGEASKIKAAKTKALIQSAISYLEKNGREKTFDAITNHSNPDHKMFIDGEFYIWIFQTDFKSNAIVKAHAVNYTLINKEWYHTKDPDGKQFFYDIVRIAKNKGEGWVLYKWAHPIHKKAVPKVVYLKRYEDLVFLNGFYL